MDFAEINLNEVIKFRFLLFTLALFAGFNKQIYKL